MQMKKKWAVEVPQGTQPQKKKEEAKRERTKRIIGKGVLQIREN